MLDPEITFLNHGSYGSCPIPVFEDYQNWQKKLENQPVQFMTNFLWENLKKSREYLADYINCSESDILLFPNPTTALYIFSRDKSADKWDLSNFTIDGELIF